MAFNTQTFSRQNSAATTGAPAFYTYISASDSLATIRGSGYFNDINLSNGVQIGDLMWLVGSDAAGLSKITAVSPNVTLSTVV